MNRPSDHHLSQAQLNLTVPLLEFSIKSLTTHFQYPFIQKTQRWYF
ncbi:hypothetical protein H6F87_02875 [Cyanobacteria bacterium FACHB-502]|nr:hypothetical protein [Cyanobacteria bacterium FACHB-502]